MRIALALVCAACLSSSFVFGQEPTSVKVDLEQQAETFNMSIDRLRASSASMSVGDRDDFRTIADDFVVVLDRFRARIALIPDDPLPPRAGLTPDANGNVRVMAGQLGVLNGTLKFRTLTIDAGGALSLYPGARLTVLDLPFDFASDPEQMGHGIIVNGGTLSIEGTTKTTATRATGSLTKGQTSCMLRDAPIGWNAGDELAVMDTQQRINQSTMNFMSQSEVVILESIVGNTVKFSPLMNVHMVGPKDFCTAHIVNLTRDILIESENPIGTRGHIIAINGGTIRAKHAAFRHLGRTTAKRQLDSTYRDAHGVLVPMNGNPYGTNQIGRYSIHGHNPMGDAGPNVTIDLDGVIVRDFLKIGVSLHGTQNAMLRNGACFNGEGAGVFGEEGSESGLIENWFCGKLTGGYSIKDGGVKSQLDRGGNKIFDTAMDGSGFWLRGYGIDVRTCIAADIRNAGFSWNGYYANRAILKIGSANTDLESYCAAKGFYSVVVNPPKEPLMLDDLLGWSVWQAGVDAYHTGSHRFKRARLYNSEAISSKNSSYRQGLTLINTGFAFSPATYPNADHELIDCEVEGFNVGVNVPQNVMESNADKSGTFLIQGGMLKNFVNIMAFPTKRESSMVPPDRFATVDRVTFKDATNSTRPVYSPTWFPETRTDIWMAPSPVVVPYSRSHVIVITDTETFGVFHKDDPMRKCEGVRDRIVGYVCDDL